MTNLHTHGTPRMTAALVKAGAFRKQPFTVVDVGAREGVAPYWQVFGDDLRIVGFDLDAEECARMNGIDPRTKYLPFALDGKAGKRKVHVTKYLPATSFFRPNPEFYGRHTTSDIGTVIVSEPVVETVTLPEALSGLGWIPDFLKLDAEGVELEIMQGAESLLPRVIGILTEVRFTRSMCGSTIFWEVEKYAREQGYELYDLDTYRVSKKHLPYPYLYSNKYADGSLAAGPATQGQLWNADALYFRDLIGKQIDARTAVAAACLFEIFGLSDCAAELILANKEAFARLAPVDTLLDLLVPEVKGRRLSYKEYMARDIVRDPLLRPKDLYRFPESVIPTYDGIFIPGWESNSLWKRIKALFR